MGKIWINPMTGQQMNLPTGQTPTGCWTAIGDAPDDWCKDIVVITPETPPVSANMNNDIDMVVGDDFIAEDDQF